MWVICLRAGQRASAVGAVCACAFGLDGCYAGVNAGGGFGRVRDNYVTPAFGGVRTSGAWAALQVGYNYEVGDYMLGVETDYDIASLKGDLSRSASNLPWNGFSPLARSVRVGATMNAALLYATGGYAYGRNKVTMGLGAPPPRPWEVRGSVCRKRRQTR